jgi:hypothetical protein
MGGERVFLRLVNGNGVLKVNCVCSAMGKERTRRRTNEVFLVRIAIGRTQIMASRYIKEIK